MLASRFCVFAAVFALGACADGTATPSADEMASFGVVHLALSSANLGGAARMELDFTPADSPSAQPTVADAFDVGAGLDTVSRNFRLPVGVYDIRARALDRSNAPLLQGATRAAVRPGQNEITIPLAPAGEDLGDLRVGFTTAQTSIAYVAADGDTSQDGRLAVMVSLTRNDPLAPLPRLRVQGIVTAVDETFVPSPRVAFELTSSPGEPLNFRGSVASDWLGVAHLTIRSYEDDRPADATTKDIIGHPSSETKQQMEALRRALELLPDGTLAAIAGAAAGSLALTPEGVTRVNDAIASFNRAVRDHEMSIAADFGNVVPALVYCSHGYWWCVAKILKCELYSAGCVAAAPAAVAGCGSVCTGTLGLGCISCVVAATAGTVSLCEDAYDCWSEASREGCL